MSSAITCVVAEDEQLFRDALVELLRREWPALDIVAACDDGAEALEVIGDRQPMIAFLDIRMPGLTGLEVARAMQTVSPDTQIVFVTAYDAHALAAFDAGAVDYLLKPVERERLLTTIARLRQRLADGSDVGAAASDKLVALLAQLTAGLPRAQVDEPLVWITASAGRETRLIHVNDVIHFQSDNKYTVVITADGEAVVRMPLRELVRRLDGNLFKQIHRSSVVNLREIASITRDDTGRGTIRLKRRAETLPISLSFMPLFKSM